MGFSTFKNVFERGCDGSLYGSELNSEFRKVAINPEISKFIVDEILGCSNNLDTGRLGVLLKAAYVYRDKAFAQPITNVLANYQKFDDNVLFNYISEVEFSFTVLGVIGDECALETLEYYALRVFSWDDLSNINKAAMYGIAKIGGAKSREILIRLSEGLNEQLSKATVGLLRRMERKQKKEGE